MYYYIAPCDKKRGHSPIPIDMSTWSTPFFLLSKKIAPLKLTRRSAFSCAKKLSSNSLWLGHKNEWMYKILKSTLSRAFWSCFGRSVKLSKLCAILWDERRLAKRRKLTKTSNHDATWWCALLTVDSRRWQPKCSPGSQTCCRGERLLSFENSLMANQKLHQTRRRSTALSLFNSDISVVLQLWAIEGIYSGILWQGKGKPSTWDGLERPNTHDHPKIDDSNTLCSSYSTQL